MRNAGKMRTRITPNTDSFYEVASANITMLIKIQYQNIILIQLIPEQYSHSIAPENIKRSLFF